MKTEALDPGTLDDLIFESRNKDYGAYHIRKSYSKNMMTGLGFSVSIACLLVILPQLLALFGNEQSLLPTVKDHIFDSITLGPPPVIQPPAQVTPPPSAPRQSVNTNLPPEVTTRQVETVIPPNNDVVAPSTEGTADGIGEVVSPFTGTGTDDIIPVEPITTVLNIAEVMPEYEGGTAAMMKFIVKHTRFPSSARHLEIEGTVFVSFVVDSEGNVVDVKVVRGICADCDKEAARVISMMRGWKAGMQNHRPVSVRMTLPIRFQLQKEI